MNNENFFTKLLAGFKDMFKSNQNIRVIAILSIVLFLVLFMAFGGCTSCGGGCVCSCSCGDGGSSGGSGGANVEKLYDGMEIDAISVIDEYSDVAATVYYPVDVYTATEDSAEFWANWCGAAAVYADGKFSIQPNLNYFSNSYTADGAGCTSFAEVEQSVKDRYGDNPLTYGDMNVGSYDGFWRVYGGWLTVYLPVDNGGNQLLEVHVIPPELDQNASDATAKAAALAENQELIALLGAIKITTVDAVPDPSTAVFYKNASDNNGGTAEGSDSASVPDVSGENYDTGSFTALVPKGWKAFPVTDMWSDDPNALNPDALQICKGGESEWDIFSKPYVQIDFYGADDYYMTPDISWYENAQELDDIKVGGYTWHGFNADDLLGSRFTLLWSDETDGVQYQATVYYGTDGTITLDDEGLLAILGTLKAN